LNAFSGSAVFSAARENDLYQAGFDASWEIDLFGRVQRSIEAAQASLEAVEADQDAVQVSLIGELARAYVELRGLQRRLAVARDGIASQADSASIVRSRAQAGLTSELDLARAQALVAGSRARVPELERDLREHAHRIALLLGEAPGALLSELGGESAIPEPLAQPDLGLPARLLVRRPDLKRAERELAAQSARIGAAEAARYPRLDLLGSLAWLATELRDLPEGDSLAWSLGSSLGLTVYDAGRKEAQVEIEAARAAGLEIAYRQAVLAALKEVEDALASLEAARLRAGLLAEVAGEQRRAAELAQELYTAGLTDYLAVLDAQRQLLDVQDQLAQAQAQHSVQFVAVCKALGGGWDPAAPRAAVEEFSRQVVKPR
jgi:NodT family efflux transporter outer membrane factor (OMF) lipoprotein